MGSPFDGEAAMSPASGYAGDRREGKVLLRTSGRRDGLDLDHEMRVARQVLH
jgi:hypothetical protein